MLKPGHSITATPDATIDVAGIASDRDRIASVAWRAIAGTHTEASGAAATAAYGGSPTDRAWSCTVPLMLGHNVITITATTLAGGTGSDTVDVERIDPPPA